MTCPSLLTGCPHDLDPDRHRRRSSCCWASSFVVGFNKLRTQDIGAEEALGGIDVQLTRRADLIPNLVNTVKGYAAHEKAVFEEVTAARAGVHRPPRAAPSPRRPPPRPRCDQAMVNVLAVAEAYPELKASANFLQLQEQLAETENQLAFARQYYNDAVGQLNTLGLHDPVDVLRRDGRRVRQREFYEAPAGQKAPPTV